MTETATCQLPGCFEKFEIPEHQGEGATVKQFCSVQHRRAMQRRRARLREKPLDESAKSIAGYYFTRMVKQGVDLAALHRVPEAQATDLLFSELNELINAWDEEHADQLD